MVIKKGEDEDPASTIHHLKSVKMKKKSATTSFPMTKLLKKSLSMKKKKTKTKKTWNQNWTTSYRMWKRLKATARVDIRENRIIKSLQDLKVITKGNSVVCFYRHPVNGNKDESALY